MIHYLNTNYDLNDKETVSVIDELPLWSAAFGLKLLEKINYRKNITALDIGSGLGFPLLEVAMRLGNSSRVYGIDPWEVAIERIKTKIKIYGINNVEVIAGVAEKIPLPDNSVDLILSNNGLNNVNNLKKAIEEISRVSKTGSQLVFTYNTDRTMIEFYSVMEAVLRERNLLNEIDAMKKHIYKKRRPVDEYRFLLEENGFAVKEIFQDEFNLLYADGTTMLNHFLITLAFIESWKEIVPEERQIEVFTEVEKQLNKLAENDGVFRLTIPYVLLDSEKVRNNN
jgi:ubiquinone/menaquinone biosynthesis C-methylase UbiE